MADNRPARTSQNGHLKHTTLSLLTHPVYFTMDHGGRRLATTRLSIMGYAHSGPNRWARAVL